MLGKCKLLLSFFLLLFLSVGCFVIYSTSSWFKTGERAHSSVYETWLMHHGKKYKGKASLNDGKKNSIALHWFIDEVKSELNIAAAVYAKGWIGIGISEAGGMPGADIVVFEARLEDVRDYYVKDDYKRPLLDNCQDWNLIRFIMEDGFLIFEAKRKLNTFDPQDHEIKNDNLPESSPHKVIAAWGNSDDMNYHGLNYAGDTIRFYGRGKDQDHFADTMERESTGNFFLSMNFHILSYLETSYEFFHFNLTHIQNRNKLTDNQIQITGLEAIQEGNYSFIHHMLLYGSYSENTKDSCFPGSNFFREMIWGWTKGSSPLIIPKQAGIPISKNGGFASFCLSVHFHNPSHLHDLVTNSGIRVYYTSNLRPYTASVFVLGDVFNTNQGRFLGQGISKHTFSCSEYCTESTFLHDVVVYREYYHMHGQGLRISNTQRRKGVPIRTRAIDFFDFNRAGALSPPQQPFVIKGRDTFQLSCYYNASENGIFGYGANEEMCISYLFYYHKEVNESTICSIGWNENPVCMANYSSTFIGDENVERVFGSPSTQCTL